MKQILKQHKSKTKSICVVSVLFLNALCFSAIASQCTEITDPDLLAEFRQDAQAFGKQGNTWLMLKGGFPMRCEEVDQSTQSCVSSQPFTVVTFKQGKLISGIESSGSPEGENTQFSFYENGVLKCEVLKAITTPSEANKVKADNCAILSDTVSMYEMLEQSQPLLTFGKAKLFVRTGNPVCKVEGNTAICESEGPAEVLLQAQGAPLKAIESYGYKTSKMTFHDDGDLGCE